MRIDDWRLNIDGRILVEGVGGPVVASRQGECAAGGLGAVADVVEIIRTVGGGGGGVIGGGHLAEGVVLPCPVCLRASEGGACGGDGVALGDGIHAISEAGNDGGSSFIFQTIQDIPRGLVGAGGDEGGIGSIAGEGVSYGKC